MIDLLRRHRSPSQIGGYTMSENTNKRIELQQDYHYYLAQKAADELLANGLISLSEFNKLTQINRDTFSPYLVEIMPKIG